VKGKRVLSLLVVIAVGMLLGRFTGGDLAGSPASSPSTSPPAVSAPASPATVDVPVSGSTDPVSGLTRVAASELPEQARATLRRIDLGGPYRYVQDGTTFNNYERLLPPRPRGYYTEYTVPTPGSDDRGPRRIVAGEDGDFYWTKDHYSHFERIIR
jgi:ribonuclease T1